MKVLICLFAALAAVNAGHLVNGVYGGSGLIRAAPVALVQSAPAVHVIRQPAVHSIYSAPAPIYNSAAIYNSAPIVSAAPAFYNGGAINSGAIIGAGHLPIVAHPYAAGLAYGPSRYAHSYGFNGYAGINGILKTQ